MPKTIGELRAEARKRREEEAQRKKYQAEADAEVAAEEAADTSPRCDQCEQRVTCHTLKEASQCAQRRKFRANIEKWSESDSDNDDPCAVIYMRCKTCKMRVGAHSIKESKRCGLI